MINEHLPGCDCYDCLDKSVIGSFVHSTKPVVIYNAMGGTVFRTAKENRTVGKIVAINSKGNWLYVEDPYANNGIRYVNVTKDLTFTKPTELTPEQKREAITTAIKASTSSGAGAGSLSVGTIEASEKAGEAIVKFLPNIKWLIIGVIVFLVLILVIKIK